MKRIVIAGLGLLVVVVVAAVGYNVWSADREAVTAPPSLLDQGRMQLHAQLEQARQAEGEAEKQNWNSPERLAQMVKGHEHRIEQLQGNTQAGEILAYDREAVTRLQDRIAELAAQEKARAESAANDGNPPQTP